jgi:hypothetical protein
MGGFLTTDYTDFTDQTKAMATKGTRSAKLDLNVFTGGN